MCLHSFLKSAILLLSGTALFAAPMITLNTTIPSQLTQIPHSICASNKGGYLVCGTTIDSNGHKNGFLLRTNQSGIQDGRITISSAGQEIEMLSTYQTFDGGYAVSGYVNPGYYGNEDWGIIKYNSLGKRLWTRQFGYSGNDRPLCMIQTADSGFLMAGYTVGSSLDTTVAIKKLDKNGLTQWDVLRRTTWSIFTSAKQTRDKGYIITGGVRSAVNGKEALLSKVDSLGNVQWYKPYGGKKDEIGYSVDTTSDGGYIVAGSTTSYGKGKEDALVFKVDSLGNLQWYKTFGGTESDEALAVIQRESDYYFAGNMRSFSADSAAMVFKMGSKGDSVWSIGFQGLVCNNGSPLQKIGFNLYMFCYSHIEKGDTVVGIAAPYTIMDVDGNIYTTAKIGNQLWTIENLRTTRYNDGTQITHITDNNQWSATTSGAYCFYNNSTNPVYQEKWGALYNWYAVSTGNLAPVGWRVPTDTDWTILENYLITNGYNCDSSTSGNKIGKSLAAKTDWVRIIGTATGIVGIDPSSNNRSGFSALGGGSRFLDGTFYHQNFDGYWWCATEHHNEWGAWFRYLKYGRYSLLRNYGVKGGGFSVRLVRD